MTLGDAMAYWTKVAEAEKVMGPLTREEKLVILGTIGTEITAEELKDLVKGKKTLVIKQKETENGDLQQ